MDRHHNGHHRRHLPSPAVRIGRHLAAVCVTYESFEQLLRSVWRQPEAPVPVP
jgi:hypothetical protein